MPARRRTLTDRGVAALRPREARYAFPDPELRGHYIRIQPTGARSYVAVVTDPKGKQVWTTIGAVDAMDNDTARERARATILRVRGQGCMTFADAAQDYLKRRVEPRGVRTQGEIERCLKKHILPEWGHREFTSIRRRDIATLLDGIEDASGPRQADVVLTIIRAICHFHATRNDDYHSPVVKGMKRSSTPPRDRILTDDEIRLVWNASDGTYGDIVKIALLTGQRRDMLASMRWSDITLDGAWAIPDQGKRSKGNGGELVLPERAMEIIKARPRIVSNQFVFPGRGSENFRAFATCKARLDNALGKGMEPWTLHDLRRTARSLMSRAGVQPHIAERVLGHVQPGVAGIYDRHSYRDEKADALQRLAGLIDGIIDRRENVVRLRKA